MELKELWRIIKKRLVMVVVITLVATITSGVLSKFVLSRQYAGTATLIVIPHNSTQDLLTSMVTGQQLVDTYAQLVTSREVVQPVYSGLHSGMSLTKFTGAITATPETNTDLLTVTVKGSSPAFASRVANLVASQTVATVARVEHQKDLQVITPASPNPIAVSPKSKTNVAIAFVLGLLVSGGLAFLLEYLDDSVHSEDDVKRYFGLPVLTVIPTIDPPSRGKSTPLPSSKGTRRRGSSPTRVERG